MDAKGKGKMVEELPMMGESFTSSESLPLLAATDHETDHEDVGDAKVTISLGELQIGESLTSNESLPLLATEHAEELVLLDLPPLVVDNNVHIDDEAQEEVEENVLPDVGAHNIRNVRGRPKRRPFTEPLSPRSQARANEREAKKEALKKAENRKKSKLNVPNHDGLKKAEKEALKKAQKGKKSKFNVPNTKMG